MRFEYYSSVGVSTVTINFTPRSNLNAFVYSNKAEISGSELLGRVSSTQASNNQVLDFDIEADGSVTWLTTCDQGYIPSNGVFPATDCIKCPTYTSSNPLMNTCPCIDGYYDLIDSSSDDYYTKLTSLAPEAICRPCAPGIDCQYGKGTPKEQVKLLEKVNIKCPHGCSSTQCLPNYEGDLCDSCKSGHYNQVQECKTCGDSSILIVALFGSLLVVPIVLFLLSRVWKRLIAVSISLFFLQEVAILLYTDVLWTTDSTSWYPLSLLLFDSSWSQLSCLASEDFTKLFPLVILPVALICEIGWRSLAALLNHFKNSLNGKGIRYFLTYSQPSMLLTTLDVFYLPMLVSVARFGICRHPNTPDEPYFMSRCPNFTTAIILYLVVGLLLPALHIAIRVYFKKRKHNERRARSLNRQDAPKTVSWPRNQNDDVIPTIVYKCSAKHPQIVAFQYVRRFLLVTLWYGAASWSPSIQAQSIATIQAFSALIVLLVLKTYKGKLGLFAIAIQTASFAIVCGLFMVAAIQVPFYKPLTGPADIVVDMKWYLLASIILALLFPAMEVFFLEWHKSDPELYKFFLTKPSNGSKKVSITEDEEGNTQHVVYMTKKSISTFNRDGTYANEPKPVKEDSLSRLVHDMEIQEEEDEVPTNQLNHHEESLRDAEEAKSKEEVVQQSMPKMTAISKESLKEAEQPSEEEYSIQQSVPKVTAISKESLRSEPKMTAISKESVRSEPQLAPSGHSTPIVSTNVLESEFGSKAIVEQEEARLEAITSDFSHSDSPVIVVASEESSNPISAPSLQLEEPVMEQSQLSAASDMPILVPSALEPKIDAKSQDSLILEALQDAKSQSQMHTNSRRNLFKKTKSKPMMIEGPTDVKHTGHLDADNVMLHHIPSEYKDIIAKAGVSEDDLKDPETFKFIIQFIVKNSVGTVKTPKVKNRQKIMFMNSQKQLETIETNSSSPNLLSAPAPPPQPMVKSTEILPTEQPPAPPLPAVEVDKSVNNKGHDDLLGQIRGMKLSSLKKTPVSAPVESPNDLANALANALHGRKGKVQEHSSSESSDDEWD